jgi:hypothetical protein
MAKVEQDDFDPFAPPKRNPAKAKGKAKPKKTDNDDEPPVEQLDLF